MQEFSQINYKDVLQDIEYIKNFSYDLGLDLEYWLMDHYDEDGVPIPEEDRDNEDEDEDGKKYDILFITQLVMVFRSLERRSQAWED